MAHRMYCMSQKPALKEAKHVSQCELGNERNGKKCPVVPGDKLIINKNLAKRCLVGENVCCAFFLIFNYLIANILRNHALLLFCRIGNIYMYILYNRMKPTAYRILTNSFHILGILPSELWSQ